MQTIRGREASTIAKWQKAGWEFVTQGQGTLRREMTFRRVKPKDPWQQLAAFAGKSWAAFRRLEPKTQLRLIAGSGGLVLLMVFVGVVAGIQGGGATSDPATLPTKAAVVPNVQPSKTPPGSTVSASEAVAYKYQGPKYEIVITDRNQGPAALNQYWVYTRKIDYSTVAYKDQVKMIITDIAHIEGTDKFLVEVVTDKEIAEAESPSTYESFIEEHGMNYAIKTIPQHEKAGWVASYSGGFDSDAGEPSDSVNAFEVIWRPYATSKIEKWRPEAMG
ncbi:hypothetical protein EAH86_17735 [Pedococcus bigeumensis]|uniref:Uncharacterized protein n=1 Tax=Pedococcus bigeumensis TaxID=433644 RepID=A0A502CK54_9MICO|nr:hypothetical protein EAH86_17735 [Pedococcus bigeumensis]